MAHPAFIFPMYLRTLRISPKGGNFWNVHCTAPTFSHVLGGRNAPPDSVTINDIQTVFGHDNRKSRKVNLNHVKEQLRNPQS